MSSFLQCNRLGDKKQCTHHNLLDFIAGIFPASQTTCFIPVLHANCMLDSCYAPCWNGTCWRWLRYGNAVSLSARALEIIDNIVMLRIGLFHSVSPAYIGLQACTVTWHGKSDEWCLSQHCNC